MVAVVFGIAVLLVLAITVRGMQSSQGFDALAAAIGQFIKPALIPLVNLINDPAFVYVAAMAILLSSLVVMVVYWQRVIRPQIAAYRRAEVEIAALPKPFGADWRTACDGVTAVLERNGVLISPWLAFTRDAAERRRLPSRSVSHYAAADPTNSLNWRGGFMAALPSYYTTLGLILTFVGLVVALYFAARGFRSGDMTEARQAIVQLLNASAFKFLTSVAALISAFFVSLTHRYALSRLRRNALRLVAAVDLRLQVSRAFAAESGNDTDPAILMAEKFDQILDELSATRTALTQLASFMQKERA